MDNLLWVIGAAFLGGIISALLGWTESSEPFNGKKFVSSVIRSVIGAAGIAIAFNFGGGEISATDILVAFLAGAGVDAGLQRASASIKAGLS